MIHYKYSIYWDFVFMKRTIKKYKKLKSYGLVVFRPSLVNFFKLLCGRKPIPTEDIFSDKDVTCYFVSSGTWGAYTPPDKIFICPWKIHKAGGLKKVIQHEITHLRHFYDVAGMTHQEKEEFINAKERASDR